MAICLARSTDGHVCWNSNFFLSITHSSFADQGKQTSLSVYSNTNGSLLFPCSIFANKRKSTFIPWVLSPVCRLTIEIEMCTYCNFLCFFPQSKYDNKDFCIDCFWWTRSPFWFIFSSVAPQRTAYSEEPSRIAAHLRSDIVHRVGWEDCRGFEPGTAGLT